MLSNIFFFIDKKYLSKNLIIRVILKDHVTLKTDWLLKFSFAITGIKFILKYIITENTVIKL